MTEMKFQGDAATLAALLQFDLADRLKKSLRISQVGVQEIATEVGVDRNTISAYINGRGVPKRATLIVWAMRTGVPLEWLETGEMPAAQEIATAGGGRTFLPPDELSGPPGDRTLNPRIKSPRRHLRVVAGVVPAATVVPLAGRPRPLPSRPALSLAGGAA